MSRITYMLFCSTVTLAANTKILLTLDTLTSIP